jgi:hypothetical protein
MQTAAWRKMVLKLDYQFDCQCIACDGDLEDPTSIAYHSAQRREKIKDILRTEPHKYANLPTLFIRPREAWFADMKFWMELISLYEQEGLVEEYMGFA